MPQPAQLQSLYEQLMALPEGLTGEIIGGQLYAQPRPAPRHAVASSSLGGELVEPFQKGRGGPGGWWIIDEPEIHFVGDIEVLVPDLAGWRRKRLPVMPTTAYFGIVPDWICEVLSPPTSSKDREVKMPIYARNGVSYAWLIDPDAKTLEALTLSDGGWSCTDKFNDDAKVCVAPFDQITITLSDLWS